MVDRDAIVDERDAAIKTDAIRLHRLVREVAAARHAGDARKNMRRALMAALEAVYPRDGYNNPASWSRRELLHPHLLASFETERDHGGASARWTRLAYRAARYLYGRAFGAGPLFEGALEIREKVLAPERPDTATDLNDLAGLLWTAHMLSEAAPILRRALTICEKSLGPGHPSTVTVRTNLSILLRQIENGAPGDEP